MENLELVITSPTPTRDLIAYRSRCRTTLGAITQIMAESHHRILLSAPYMWLSAEALQPMRDALASAAARGVSLTVLSTSSGLDHFRSVLGSDRARSVSFYVPSAHLLDDRRIGSHAKFCVGDSTQAYIGSANFTGPALDEHVELGVFVRGEVAQQVEDFVNRCIEAGLFVAA